MHYVNVYVHEIKHAFPSVVMLMFKHDKRGELEIHNIIIL